MNKWFTLVMLITSIFPAATAQTNKSAQDSLRRDMDNARRKVYPALVNITVVTRYFQGGRAQRAPAGGSGVIVSAQGHVITNFHVAGHTARITCTLTDGEAIEASVVAHDPLTDLSVLKLRLDKRSNPMAPIPFALFGDSDKIETGDYVMAMGNPLLLSSSMTLGIVSNTKRVFTDFIGTEIEDQDLDTGERTGMFTRWIQHDALILPGNSGGPLVNLSGEVIGINELGGAGVGFAIPSNIAANVLKQSLASGSVRRGWLGITVLPVDKIGRKTGALVSALMPGGSAQKAGLHAGDIITSMNGGTVNVRFFEEVPIFYQQVAALTIGKSTILNYERDGISHKVDVPVIPMEKTRGDEEEFRDLGMSFREITGPMALAMRFPDTHGVFVTGIRPGWPLDGSQPKLQPGDVITAIGDKLIQNSAEFRQALKPSPKSDFTVTVRRGTESIVSVIKPKDRDPQDDGGELPHAWIGVKTQVISSELAKAMGIPKQKGFRVTLVYPSTEAQKAGLKSGDILTSLNGRPLVAFRQQDEGDFKRAIEELSIGEKAEIGILRSAKPQKLTVVLQEPPAPADKAKRITHKEFEFAGREITPMDKLENRWQADQGGVLVTEVTPGGWAQMAGLRTDDLILSVNNHSTPNADAFEKQMKAVMTAHPKVVRVFVLREAQTHFIFIEPDWAKLSNGN